MKRLLFLSNKRIEVEINGPSPDDIRYPLAPCSSEITLSNVITAEVLEQKALMCCPPMSNSDKTTAFHSNQGNSQSFQVPPLFFEDCEYLLLVSEKGRSDDDREVNEPLMIIGAPLERITRSKNNTTLYGILRMHGEVGTVKCVVQKGNERLMAFALEFFPSKMDYRNDYQRLLQELESEIHGLTYSIFRNALTGADPLLRERQSTLEWLSLLRGLFTQFTAAFTAVVKSPHRVMHKEERVVQISRVKHISSETRRWLRTHPSHIQTCESRMGEAGKITLSKHCTAEGLTPGMLPDKLLETHRTLSFECLENRYLYWAIEEIQRRVRDLRAVLPDIDNEKRNSTLIFLNEVEEWCMRSLRESPLKGLSGLPLKGRFSPVLQWAGGYREFHRNFLLLQHSLSLSGRALKLQLKNLHELYEYWCFLHIVQFLRKELELKNQDLIGLDIDSIIVKLAKGRRSELIFAGEDGKEVTLFYNPSFPWPDAKLSGGQRPDIVLQFWQRNSKERQHIATYIFDAKYRIETDKDYLMRYGCPGPPESAINQMHRYRDALFEHFSESGAFERVAYGAYVLFPFHDERSFSESRFFRSVHTINVGAFPALPGHTSLIDDFLLHLLTRSGLFHDCAVAPLKLASWERFRDESRHLVLIIRVPPADRDMQWISSQRLCYIDAKPENLRPSGARFIAFYEPENRCIRYYACVSSVILAERRSIHTPWASRRSDNHLCWLFSIGPMEQLPHPIQQHMNRTAWRYANLYSLLHSRSMEELVLTTERERLIKEALDSHKITYKIKTLRWDIRDDEAQAAPEFHFFNSRGLQCIIRPRRDGVPVMIVCKEDNMTTESLLSQRDIIHGRFL